VALGGALIFWQRLARPRPKHAHSKIENDRVHLNGHSRRGREKVVEAVASVRGLLRAPVTAPGCMLHQRNVRQVGGHVRDHAKRKAVADPQHVFEGCGHRQGRPRFTRRAVYHNAAIGRGAVVAGVVAGALCELAGGAAGAALVLRARAAHSVGPRAAAHGAGVETGRAAGGAVRGAPGFVPRRVRPAAGVWAQRVPLGRNGGGGEGGEGKQRGDAHY
jgi:hypothetical protein